MIISKKTLLSTAVKAALIGAITIPMVGCDDAETYNQQQYVEAESNFVQQQRQQLVGNVQGVVLDSNGNPLENAEVSIGTQTTTTDALGYYAFADVAAVNVALNADSNVLTAVPLVISVSAEGHLGGRTQASPTAISDTLQYVYIDGFTAQAKNLYLPELTASVKATLRSSVTGEAIANQKVTLEFVGVDAGLTGNNNDGDGEFSDIASTYFAVTTDANGAFVAENLPANSSFNVLVEDYRVDGESVLDETGDVNSDVALTTGKEAIVSNWGEIFVTREVVADEIHPFVINIEKASSAGVLAKGEDGTALKGGLVFDFSESVSVLNTTAGGLDESTIKVVFKNSDGTSKYVTATSIITNNSIQLNLAQAILPGQEVYVYFERADFVDASENELVEDDSGTGNAFDENDVKDQLALNDKYIKYTLTGYEASAELAGDLTIIQTFADTLEFSELSTHNAALVTVADSHSIEQLNDNSGHTQTLLKALATQLVTVSGVDGPASNVLVTTTARVVINLPDNTAFAFINVTDEEGDSVGSVIRTEDGTLTSTTVDNITTSNIDSDDTVFYISDTAPGHIVTVTATDVFGVVGVPASTQLVDKVAPTTVIQNSYLVDIGGNLVTGVSASNVEIDGGQNVTSGVTGSLGYPYITLAPAILDLETLVADDNETSNSSGASVYDQGEFTAWEGSDIVTAVAFSENISWKTGTPTQTAVASLTETLLTSFDIVNGVPANGNGGGVDNSVAQDFVTFNVNNIFTLANDNHGAELSFDGLVIDSNGIDASAAKVVVRDALPPMIASAVFSGRYTDNVVPADITDTRKLVITFNEAISPKANYTATTEPSVFRMVLDGKTYSTDTADTADVDIDASDIEFGAYSITLDVEHLDSSYSVDYTAAEALEGQAITDLKVNIADLHGNSGDSQYGNASYNYNGNTDELMFKVNNITIATQ